MGWEGGLGCPYYVMNEQPLNKCSEHCFAGFRCDQHYENAKFETSCSTCLQCLQSLKFPFHLVAKFAKIENFTYLQCLKSLKLVFPNFAKIENFTCLHREALEHLFVQQSAVADLE